MMPGSISRNGLCDFRIPGTRRPEHRDILIYHLYLWLWHNNWDKIPIERLWLYSYRQLIGMLQAIVDGRGSWLMDLLLHEYGYDPRQKGLPPPPYRDSRQLKLDL
jgi:hypothetical protein